MAMKMKRRELRRRKKLYEEVKEIWRTGRRTPVEVPWPDGDYSKAPFASSKLTETESLKVLRNKVMEGIAAGMSMGGDPGGFVMLIDEELNERRKRAR